MSWDCWLGDEDGENKVHLAGPYQPQPIPMPKRKGYGSEHVAINGSVVPQSFSNDMGVLVVNLTRITRDMLEAIEAIYVRTEAGGKPDVQFNNSLKTYLCAWAAQDWDPIRTVRAPERYQLQFTLHILGEVEPEEEEE